MPDTAEDFLRDLKGQAPAAPKKDSAASFLADLGQKPVSPTASIQTLPPAPAPTPNQTSLGDDPILGLEMSPAAAPMANARDNIPTGAEFTRRREMMRQGIDPATGKPLGESYLGRVVQSLDVGAPIRNAIEAGGQPGATTAQQVAGATGAALNTAAQALAAPLAPIFALPGVHQAMGKLGEAGTAIMRPAARMATDPSVENAMRMVASDPLVDAVTGRPAPQSPLVDEAASALFNVASMAATPGITKSVKEAWRGPNLPDLPVDVPSGGTVRPAVEPATPKVPLRGSRSAPEFDMPGAEFGDQPLMDAGAKVSPLRKVTIGEPGATVVEKPPVPVARNVPVERVAPKAPEPAPVPVPDVPEPPAPSLVEPPAPSAPAPAEPPVAAAPVPEPVAPAPAVPAAPAVTKPVRIRGRKAKPQPEAAPEPAPTPAAAAEPVPAAEPVAPPEPVAPVAEAPKPAEPPVAAPEPTAVQTKATVPAEAPPPPVKPEPRALESLRAAAKATDIEGARDMWRTLTREERSALEAHYPAPTDAEIATLPKDRRAAGRFGWNRVEIGLRKELGQVSAPQPAAPVKIKGASRMPRGRGASAEVGAVRVPTGADIDRATEPLRRVYQRLVGDNLDALAQRSQRFKPFRTVRQYGVNEALRADATEALHRGELRARGEKAWGRRIAEKDIARPLDKALKGVPEADVAQAYRYMGGETQSLPSTISARARQLLDAASAHIHNLRTEMLARKLISKAVFDEYPRFVSRIMRDKIGGSSFFKSGVEKLPREHLRMDAHGVILEHGKDAVTDLANSMGVKTKVITGTDRQTVVKFENAADRNAFIAQARKKFGHTSKSSGWFDSFDPLSDAERAMLDELVDPADSFSVTAARAQAKIAAHDLLANIETSGRGMANGDWIVRSPSSSAPPAGYVELTGDTLGPLRPRTEGERVFAKPEIHDYIQSVGTPEQASSVLRGLVDGYSEWRKDRTSRSWPTMIRNWLSHGQMTAEAGVNILNPLNAKYHADFLGALSGRNPKMLERLVKDGVIGQDWYSEMNRQRIADALGTGQVEPWRAVMRWIKENSGDPKKAKSAEMAAASGAFRTVVEPLNNVPGFRKLDSVAGYLYGLQQDMVRGPAYLKLRDKGLSHKAAMLELEQSTDSYSRHGPIQRGASFVPIVGPFARFGWERFRIGYNNLRKHPVRLAETVAFSYLAKKALEAAFSEDVTDEERDAIAGEYGWQTAALGRDEKGRVRTLDLRYLSSLGPLLAGPERDKYDSNSEAWLAYLMRATGMGLNPGVAISVAGSTGNTIGGRPVSDSFTRERYGAPGTAFEIWREFIGHPLYGRTADDLLASMSEVSANKKRPAVTPNDVILGYVTGLSMGRFDPDLARKNIDAMLSAKRATVEKDRRERIRLMGPNPDPEDVTDLNKRTADMLSEYNRQESDRMDRINRAIESREKALPQDGDRK